MYSQVDPGWRRFVNKLTEEIVLFHRVISPTVEEHQLRERAVSSVSTAIKMLWNDSEISLFGSFLDKAYLPGGDIDICVGSCPVENQRTAIHHLSSHLTHLNMVSSIEPVLNSQVFPFGPILTPTSPSLPPSLPPSFHSHLAGGNRSLLYFNSTSSHSPDTPLLFPFFFIIYF
eukprot:TRINITY_DN5094_c0_g1_i13.p1 TRINITY_DN5094_c0_g1~~TRINITY_DN5094_c0_g1_i13.p1  ORF type:complete len:173 (+),score=20.57 TRINITY_DN5094_c0_g1_i13:192-710(+)